MTGKLEDNYTFDYDAQCKCSIVTWHGRSTESQLREINERFLEFVSQHNSEKIIQDVLILSELSEEYQQWLSEDYIPRLYQAGVRFSAIVLPVRPLDSIDLENVVSRIGLKSIVKKHFSTLSAAKEWIMSA